MAIQGKCVITNDFFNAFDVYSWVSTGTSSPTSTTQWTKLEGYYVGQTSSNRQNVWLAIHPKIDTIQTNNYGYTIPYGYTTNVTLPSSSSAFSEESVYTHLINNGVRIDASDPYTPFNFVRSRQFVPMSWDLRVGDGYGGYTTVSNCFYTQFFNIPANNTTSLYSMYLHAKTVTINLSHCTLEQVINYRDLISATYTAILGQAIGESKVTPEQGYTFNSEPYYTLYDSTGGIVDVHAQDINEDETEWTFYNPMMVSIQRSNDITYIGLVAEGGSTPITENYEFIQVYNPSNEDMGDLANIRFIGVNSSGSYTVDLGQYILNVFKLYINIPTDVEQHIFLLNYDTNIECPIVSDFKVVTDCGKIYIGNTLNSAMAWDMIHEIYLPFIGIEKINPDKYIFKEVGLKYVTDILTGNTTAYTYTEVIEWDEETQEEYTREQIIDTWNKNIAYKIPYRVGNPDMAYYQDFDTNSEAYMDKTPIIYQYYPSGTMGATSDYNFPCHLDYFRTINPLRYYPIRFTDVQLDIPNATSEEKEELINLFESGVIYVKL